jgi:hypothetical protein
MTDLRKRRGDQVLLKGEVFIYFKNLLIDDNYLGKDNGRPAPPNCQDDGQDPPKDQPKREVKERRR